MTRWASTSGSSAITEAFVHSGTDAAVARIYLGHQRFRKSIDDGIGLPSSAFVETVFAMANFELTPGLSSASSCPEAIWQSAKWWTGFYKSVADSDDARKKTAVAMVPEGCYIVRQPSAAVQWPPQLDSAQAPKPEARQEVARLAKDTLRRARPRSSRATPRSGPASTSWCGPRRHSAAASRT